MMELAILLSVARTLRTQLVGSSLEDLRQEGSRFRVVFVGATGRPLTIVISIDALRPWIGRPVSRSRPEAWSAPEAFGLRREVKGLRLREVTLAAGDRVLTLELGDGHEIVAQLGRHRANLIVVGPDRTVRAAARLPRSTTQGLALGRVYVPPQGPGLPDPRTLSAVAIDRLVESARGEGLDVQALLRHSLFGVGDETARLVSEEVRTTGRSAGTVLRDRLDRIEQGRLEPIVLADGDPRVALPGTMRLLPWDPEEHPAGLEPFRGSDAASTVGLYHEALERIARLRERAQTLRSLVTAEERRISGAIERVRTDLEGFADPDIHRLRGEALLAGLSRATRVGDIVRVPDPYADDGASLAIPVRPGVPLPVHANECFKRHSRALRGATQARARLCVLEERRERLRRLPLPEPHDRDGVERLERALIELGLTLEAGRRPGIEGRPIVPRTLGVRAFAGPSGAIVLAGRNGRSNDRLTFRLARADDVWLHALGVSGSHVVLRLAPGAREPDREALLFAAGIAAWYSDARMANAVDVQWTRRRFVRRRRGAGPGTVVVKRHELLRVRPALPPESGS
jgi:predicted ribosome quality control (RQC) complex YloA/Tae2 family protein